jgi:SAM-dependent methyltransferase
MLHDRVRNEAFQQAIHRVVKPGDVVIDMGAGTGLLSLFAFQAGARKVYAVERTDTADAARLMVERNRAGEVIQIIQDDMESVRLPEKADVLVSEWLGSYAIEENMLAPLVMARDRWLKPEGKVIPDITHVWLAPTFDQELHDDLDYWRQGQHGLDFTAIADLSSQEMYYYRNTTTTEDLLAEPQLLWTIHASEVSLAEAQSAYEATATFEITRPGMMNALAGWFVAEMGGGVTLANAPGAPDTHWGRAIFPLGQTVEVEPGKAVEATLSNAPAGVGYCRAEWSVRVDGTVLRQGAWT